MQSRKFLVWTIVASRFQIYFNADIHAFEKESLHKTQSLARELVEPTLAAATWRNRSLCLCDFVSSLHQCGQIQDSFSLQHHFSSLRFADIRLCTARVPAVPLKLGWTLTGLLQKLAPFIFESISSRFAAVCGIIVLMHGPVWTWL